MKQINRPVCLCPGLQIEKFIIFIKTARILRFGASFAFWSLLIFSLSFTYRLPLIEAADEVQIKVNSADGTSTFEVRNSNDQIIARIDSAGHMLVVGSGTVNNNLTLTQGSFGLGTSSATSKIDVANGSVTIRGSGAGLSVAGVDNAHAARNIIVMWSGTLASKPAGWNLCDGTNGTPDLRDRFVYGWTNAVDPGGTGGATTHSHTVNSHSHTLGSHTHSWDPDNTQSGNNSNYLQIDTYETGAWAATHTEKHWTNIATFDTGTDNGPSGTSSPGTDAPANASLPPYYKLAFLCKE